MPTLELFEMNYFNLNFFYCIDVPGICNLKKSLLIRKLFFSESLNRSDESLYKGPSSRSRLPSASSLTTLGVQSQHLSASNPDLSALTVEESIKEYPDLVVKVYKADQTFKYLLISKVPTENLK